MKKLIFSIMISVFACVAVLAQEQKAVPFNGVVADILGQPLKGAKVWVVDPNYYTTTDKKGKFGLTNVQPTDTLHVKYKKQLYLIPVDTMKSVRVRLGDELKYEVRQDEELVNTGYGFVKRRESCNSSTGISGEVLVRTGRTDVLEALQGLVPGLSIVNGKAVIRGLATINGSPDPLFLVDGVEVESLSFVNVYVVDRVEVLKDANMYGVKGANGAILVTTKRGGSKR
jgi:TonB-dependent SusC/RagA subfamily outer membrane receptor